MKKSYLIIASLLSSFTIGFYINAAFAQKSHQEKTKPQATSSIKLGAFSMSLNVKDLNISKQFYEKLGFTTFGGGLEQNYLIMKNGNALIGLFQGMFEGNILTFNPGWDENAGAIKKFDDVRDIQKHLKKSGLTLLSEVDSTTKGPGSIILTDPDGNMILLDQHR